MLYLSFFVLQMTLFTIKVFIVCLSTSLNNFAFRTFACQWLQFFIPFAPLPLPFLPHKLLAQLN